MASEVAEVVVSGGVAAALNDPSVDAAAASAAAASFHGLSINSEPTPAGINGNVANGGGAGEETGSFEEQQVLNGSVAGPSTSVPAPVPVPVAPPTYDDIFPALPCGNNNANGPASAMTQPNVTAASMLAGSGGSRPKLRSTNVTKIYRVAPEERRYRDLARRFGDDGLNKICAEIMNKTGTEIQLTSSKDGTLSFLISGKDEATNQARRMISSEFQAQIQFQLSIPKEHHRIILGKGGKKLTDLEQSTGTKIQIPKQDENSEVIRITGTKESIDKAVHEIQLTSNEAASRSIDRVNIPKQFHPFIVGPFGEMLNRIMTETGAKVNVPPQSVNKDEISITGERNNVKAAKERVLAIYQEKERYCQSVSIEVKKAQHKYIVGPKGHTLNEIFEQTGVAVEMPSPDSPSETIVLRGEQDKLANALAVLYQKAHSETEEELEVPGWIQRHILGPKGTKFQELSLEFPKVNVSFEMEDNLIKMSGAVADVKKARELIKARADEIASLMVIEEIKVADSKHIKFVVGKNGANLKQIRDETKATIQVISNDSTDGSTGSKNTSSNAATTGVQFIRIEGTQESVAKAKQELQSLLNKLENEMTYELPIERRFYGQIIGAKGENIRDIRNKFNQVMITFPEQNGTSEKVVIRGNKKDAEQCYKHLSHLNQELLSNNYRLEVPIFTQLLQFIQRKDSIKKIREETGTRIDLPTSTENLTDMIVITGSKDKVEKALDRIQALQSSLADMSHVDILVPAKIHNYMLGSKGRNIKQIMSECGGVIINFPPEGSGSDKVQIRGPKDCVQKAKQMLMAMSNDYQTNNYSEELKVRVEHHRYLIGKNGSNINKLRDQTGVRVYFASDNGSGPMVVGGRADNKDDPERVVITGKKESVQKAVVILQEKIKELEKIVEDEMRIDPKYHSLFVARRAAVCKQLYDEYGGVNVSFPHSSDKLNDRIVLKGSKECVEQVKKRILEIIADHDAQVSVNCIIDASHHRHLLGPRSGRVQGLQQEFDVKIKFPARPKPEQNGGGQNGDPDSTEPAEPKPANNIVVITGRKENCEKASEALLALVPITDTIDIPYEYHRFIIGQKGVEVRELMDRFNVQIRVPPSADKSDEISVIGVKESVQAALEALKERLQKLEGEKADREARNFHLTFKVEPVYHPKIIGKRGAVISSIRSKFDVQIQVPESGKGTSTETSDQITVIGYEKNAMKAKEHILQIVKDLEDQTTEELLIDSKIHSRLIGTRGKNIRRIMDQYKVDIRFPRNGDANPDLVTITGSAEGVESAKEYLLETSEGYLDDIEVQYQPPQDHGFQINFQELSSSAVVKESPKGFQVRGGPWEKKADSGAGQKYNSVHLDVSSAQDFPAFGLGGPGLVSAPAPALSASGDANEQHNNNDNVVNGTDSSGLPAAATGYGQPNAWGRRK